jgi:hypothetical protein
MDSNGDSAMCVRIKRKKLYNLAERFVSHDRAMAIIRKFLSLAISMWKEAVASL